eukprot:758681-Amorphochlora_amoeboformis.AAC.1
MTTRIWGATWGGSRRDGTSGIADPPQLLVETIVAHTDRTCYHYDLLGGFVMVLQLEGLG